jgi:hypothetical protein
MSWLKRLREKTALARQMWVKRNVIELWLPREAQIGRWIAVESKMDRWAASESELDWSLNNRDRLRSWIAHEAWIEDCLANKTLVAAALEEDRKRKTLPAFHEEVRVFRRLSAASDRGLGVDDADLLPCLDDRTAETTFDRHYVYHPAWAARILAQTRPDRHVDISSILGFSTVLSAFIPVEFYDVRPAPLKIDDLHVGAADLLQLPFDDNSIPSLSCMHVIEHIGLGRYGDPLDADGDVKAIRELVRVLAPGGDLLIATPVGRRRVCFNAHRVYDHQDFAGLFAGLDLKEFALIPDGTVPDGLLYDPSAELVRAQEYGCGCFWFKKPASAGAPGEDQR